MVEELSWLMKDARGKGELKGVKITPSVTLCHLLFVDDVLLFGDGMVQELRKLKDILDLYCKVAGMQLNLTKFSLLENCTSKEVLRLFEDVRPLTI